MEVTPNFGDQYVLKLYKQQKNRGERSVDDVSKSISKRGR
jgi:hypothetical protein